MPGKYGQLYSHTECYACNRYGKFAYKIPDLKPKAMNIAIIGVIMMQNGDVIKKIWIILDTCSTDILTKNWIMLKTRRIVLNTKNSKY